MSGLWLCKICNLVTSLSSQAQWTPVNGFTDNCVGRCIDSTFGDTDTSMNKDAHSDDLTQNVLSHCDPTNGSPPYRETAQSIDN